MFHLGGFDTQPKLWHMCYSHSLANVLHFALLREDLVYIVAHVLHKYLIVAQEVFI